MKREKKQALLTSIVLLLVSYYISGCAATQTWGTYQKKSTVETELNGKADLYGTVRMARDLTVISGYSIIKHDPGTYGVITDVRIEPGSIKIKSDISGNFTCKGLEPGKYSIYFKNGMKKEKRTDVTLQPDQQLDLTIYVQGKPSWSYPLGIPGLNSFSHYYPGRSIRINSTKK